MSVTGMAGMLNLKGLTPQPLPPEEIFAGTPVFFRLKLHNAKPHIPSFLLRLECQGVKTVVIPLVPPGESVFTTMGLTFLRRGEARVASITISSPFPVNFFIRYVTISLDTAVVVFPRLLPGVAGGDSQGADRLGNGARLARGGDGELERIYGYSGCEPLRMIHWKLSARGDELLVKEYGRQAMSPLVIDLENQPGRTLEEKVSMAAWLVKHWAPLRPVGLKLAGRSIPAEVGHGHAIHLLTELALYDRD
jgi:uncharacterized protein (DUF58 family)